MGQGRRAGLVAMMIGAAGVALAACGSGGTVTTPNGTATISGHGKTATVSTSEGSATFSEGARLPQGFPSASVPLPSGWAYTGSISTSGKGGPTYMLNYHVAHLHAQAGAYVSDLEAHGFQQRYEENTAHTFSADLVGNGWQVDLAGSSEPGSPPPSVVVEVSPAAASSGGGALGREA